MADAYIQVAADGSGKKMQTYRNTIGSDSVDAEAVTLVDTTGTPITTLPVSIASNINVSIAATSNVAITKFTGAPSMFNGQVAATNVAATMVAARATRRSVTIRNIDSTNSGYIGLPVISGSNGMLLAPRESISVDYVGLIQVVTSSGNANFAYLETYD